MSFSLSPRLDRVCALLAKQLDGKRDDLEYEKETDDLTTTPPLSLSLFSNSNIM